MNAQTLLDLLTTREAAATTRTDDLREQITRLTAELTAAESELADLRTTRQTLLKLTRGELTAPEPAITSESYQRILAVFDPDGTPIRAKDVCLALGLGATANDTEGIRGKLKRLVSRQILTENKKGLFALALR